MVCFNPYLQNLEGCTATPIDQLFPTGAGRRKRSSLIGDNHFLTSINYKATEEFMDQFIKEHMPEPEVELKQ